ncbi:MAG TPA: hypothetical protein EYP14_09780 [Planctomycetaceae bacterium]|nr:hypothetical protein [Planctomycetaceae bacterium]
MGNGWRPEIVGERGAGRNGGRRHRGWRWKRWLLAGASAWCAGLTIIAFVVWALLTPPRFYQEAEESLGRADRSEQAEALVQKSVRLADDVHHRPRWSVQFTEPEINSWLADWLPKQAPEWLPPGVCDPRIALGQGTLELGFRVDRLPGRGVLSVTLRPHVLTDHRLALQIERVRAGRLPIPLDRVLEELRQSGLVDRWRTRWYLQDGRDVAVIDLNEIVDPAIRLDAIEIRDGRLTIVGSRRAPP